MSNDMVYGLELRAIPGCIGYLACEDGTIWSRWKPAGRRHGFAISEDMRQLRPERRPCDGRARYTIRTAKGKYRRKYGSHFVLEAFVGPRPHGMEACHGDGNCLNDSASNLRWDTPAANKADMLTHGTRLSGERSGMAKLLDSDIPKILSLHACGESLKSIADKFGVTSARIHQIVRYGDRC